jgi:hypothetical protein
MSECKRRSKDKTGINQIEALKWTKNSIVTKFLESDVQIGSQSSSCCSC